MVDSITYEDFCVELKNGTFFKFKYKEYEIIFNLTIKGYFKVKFEWAFRLYRNGNKKPLIAKKYKTAESLLRNVCIEGNSLQGIWEDLELISTDAIKISFEDFCANLKEGGYYELKYRDYFFNFGLETRGRVRKKSVWVYYMYRLGDDSPLIVASYKTLELMLENVYILGKTLSEIWDDVEFV